MTKFQKDAEAYLAKREIAEGVTKIKWVLRYPAHGDFEVTPVTALPISQKSLNVLLRSGLNTLNDIMDNWNKLRNYPNLGELKEREIKTKFLSYYYQTLSEEKQAAFLERSVNRTLGIA